MKERVAYLDSSAIIKRYIKEAGSEFVKQLYQGAYIGEVKVCFSIWNVGEVLGALDRAMCKGRLTEEEYATARRRFLLETRRLMKLKLLLVVPLKGKLLVEAWRIVEKHHIYQADALQIATAKQIACTEFLTGDVTLHNIALKEGLNSICLS
ncbi:MAG: type II toxin-antitoxin system VapC family toxin [archaeon YNP-LCB-003-016]|jgi:predicted nucleic acid-binding protein|uniref:type II toxin-antitoxin system VapC family toxin n=1 Tax=Candidatus Culexarchaeum yellowstonense TaxID=2928963 RepID=UPI0018412505|nr:type II toxin-antitoxin system VapC family toxin [Candidatus Culexarchaeum yellowstonense]MCC6017672.1 type II toxin-antitoxin system VapC family toxin [Candidatus Verstraetearchaeota archaeon]MCR6693108.1 type II toxin-antitoxin system VapC family toxin [Candidatus Culexarchaeum yellowstonense]